MSGFGGFGAGSTSGSFFGAKPPDQGSKNPVPITTAITTTSGLTFGTPTFGGSGLSGVQDQTSAFGSFGTKPSGTPATTTLTFGTSVANTNIPTLSSFTSNTSAPLFGTSTTVTPTFGSSATVSNVPNLGSFGTSLVPNLGTTSLGFNVPKTTTTTGFTLPSTDTSSINPPSATPTFSFGMTPATTTSTSLSFGQPTTTTSTPLLTFGVSTTAATTVTSAPTATSTTQSTGFNIQQPTTSNSLSFGIPKTTGALTFGTGSSGFGTAPTTTSTTTPTFNLGSSTTASNLGSGLFGTPKTTDTQSVTTSTATTTTTIGLGGIGNTQTSQGLSGAGTTEPKQAKDNNLPDPILQTLNDFQNFTKQQKSISVEISHGSSKPLKKVQEDTEAMESLLTMITSGLTRNAIAVDKLKAETAQGLHQAEMAQRNHETPPGLDYDNSASTDYFNDLVTKFETDTVRLRVQIEASEKHLRSLTQSSTISPQELTLAMRRLHETLIVLAARVQALHTTVQSQKEQYKNLRRVYFKDDINIFENETEQNLLKKQTVYSLRSLTGPTPFSETPGVGLPLQVDGLAMLASSAGSAIPTTSSNPSWMSPLQGTANATSQLPNANLLNNFQPLGMSGFQLSKPPTGNKRSRH